MEKMYRLAIPILPRSNLVIIEDISVGSFTFKNGSNYKERLYGLVETFVRNENEISEKLEEIQNFISFLSLIKSKELNSNFFLSLGEPIFFNKESYGKTPNGKKIPIYMSIGDEETFIDKKFIEENFKKYKTISQKIEVVRALNWYGYGKASLDDLDALISFIISLEALLGKEKAAKVYKEEIEKVKEKIKEVKDINEFFKQKILNQITSLRFPSFIEKVENLVNNLNKELNNCFAKKAEELGLNQNPVKLLSEIYSDRSKVIHYGGKNISKIKQKRKWLEIFLREVLFYKINFENN